MLNNKANIENPHPALLNPFGKKRIPEPINPLIRVKNTAVLLSFGASSLMIACFILVLVSEVLHAFSFLKLAWPQTASQNSSSLESSSILPNICL